MRSENKLAEMFVSFSIPSKENGGLHRVYGLSEVQGSGRVLLRLIANGCPSTWRLMA